jgi:hypothetical protein
VKHLTDWSIHSHRTDWTGATICRGTNNYGDGPEAQVARLEQIEGATAQDREAVVRLMMAAPDLIAALRPFANYACELPSDVRCECHNCAAKAAIARAEGRA